MLVFRITAEALAPGAPAATAFVVAVDAVEAVMLLRKDIDFTGYRLPPAEMTPVEASQPMVHDALGAAASHEKGVYGFTILGAAAAADPDTPPQSVS